MATELETNLNTPPYYDDFDESKNFHRVLFRPSVAVQARELTTLQSILQNQIDRFGKHVFVDGSIVEGCGLTFDDKLAYLKIKDNYTTGIPVQIDTLKENFLENSNGLRAYILTAQTGFESSYVGGGAPQSNSELNTLFIKYLNQANYVNGSIQGTFDPDEVVQVVTSGNVAVANVTVSNTVTVPTGISYSVTISDGIIFQKGHFIRVDSQTIVASKYDNSPNNVSVGFNTTETIVTPESDPSLLDNAAGSSNYAAPGAHRLKLTSNLVLRTTSDIANTSSFFSIVDFQNGNPVTIKVNPEYASLGRELARRTYEESGNYVVNPFVISVEEKSDTDPNKASYHNLEVAAGIGYVEGFRTELTNKVRVDIRKGTDTANASSQILSANFGSYVYVNEYSGEFNCDSLAQVELHNAAKTSITSRTFQATSFSSTTKIGTAYVAGMSYASDIPGTPNAQYKLYVFNIKMNPGFNFSDVKSIIYNVGGTLTGVADCVLESSAAVLKEASLSKLIFPFGQKSLQSLIDNTQFVYRDRQTSTIAANGTMSLTLSSVVGTGTEQFPDTGTLSDANESKFIVIATANQVSASKTGTANVTSGSNAVTGTTTTFTSDYQVGDFIQINSEQRRVTSITNATALAVDATFSGTATGQTHVKVFRNGYIIPYNQRSGRSIIANSSVARFELSETLAGTLSTKVFYNVARTDTVPIEKVINKHTYVKIHCSNNAGGVVGPWCLGLPDTVKIRGVYVGTGTTYSNTTTNYVNNFNLDTGQRDGYYDLSYLQLKGGVALTTNNNILVELDNFTFDRSQGVGFFSVDSYPTSNTDSNTSILWQEIPLYTSPTDGSIFDLRDCVDFRPFAANTADSANTVGAATINPSNTLTLSVHSNGSFIIATDSQVQSDIRYYLSRKDRVQLTPQGKVEIVEGLSAVNPLTPPDKSGAMTLGVVNVPPFPSLTATQSTSIKRYDNAISFKSLQNRRFTMKDIGAISQRVDNLEYYTSLSLLEKNTKDLTIRNSSGDDRFKNGIFVDPFNDHSLGDTKSGEYSIAIDSAKSEMRPVFARRSFSLQYDSGSSSNVTKSSDLITLPYTSSAYITQPFASKYRNCIEGNIYQWQGTITMNPDSDVAPSLTTNPVVLTADVDSNGNWVNLNNAWGTVWGNWNDSPQSSNASITSGTTGSISNNNITSITSLLNNLQITPGQNGETIYTGDIVQDVSILPYIKPRAVTFTANGLKPNTLVYAYFDNINVTAVCGKATDSTFTTVNYGTNILVTDSNGRLYGVLNIPPGTFRPGQLEFKLLDISSLTQGIDAITTSAYGTYYGSPVSVVKGNITLVTRPLPVPPPPPLPPPQPPVVVEPPPVLPDKMNSKWNIITNPPPPVIDYPFDYWASAGADGDAGSASGAGGVGGSGGDSGW